MIVLWTGDSTTAVTMEQLCRHVVRDVFCAFRVEAGSNTSTVALLVVRGEEREVSNLRQKKIWLRVPRNSDPRKTTLARASSIYKRQIRPLIREDAPEKQDRICQRVTNIWSWAPDEARHQDLLIDWPSVAMWPWLWTDSVESCSCEKWEAGRGRGEFGKPEEREGQTLETATKQRLVKNEKT
jgi:hypothetical protein